MASTRVEGRVFLRETGEGIPDLVATLYDVEAPFDARTLARSVGDAVTDEVVAKLNGRRVGSRITDSRGAFSFELNGRDESGAATTRPDLALLVFGPERANPKVCQYLLHASCSVRRDAGAREAFLVSLGIDELRVAGIELPTDAEPANEVVRRVAEGIARRTAIVSGTGKMTAEALEPRRKLGMTTVRPRVEEFVSSLAVPEVGKRGRLVRPGDSVLEASDRSISEGLGTRVNERPRVGHVGLSDAAIEELRAKYPDLTNIPAKELDHRLFRGAGPDASLLRSHPLGVECRDQTMPADLCSERAQQDEDAGDVDLPTSGEESEGGSSPDTAGLLRDVVGSLLQEMRPTSGRARTEGRATADDVHRKIQSLEFRSGPADEPAIFEFHSLQIAFEHVWQQVFDQSVYGDATELYESIVELGGDPELSPAGLIEGLRFEAHLIDRFQAQDPPVEVLQAFEVQPGEWQALGAEHRDRLIALARSIVSGTPSWLPTGIGRHEAARAQGQRIIQYARSKVKAGSSPTDRIRQRLRDLEQRLREPYAFTVYAANRQERSVNFGLLVTYRQRWEPASYQAGPLVKSLPLAPGEVRRYSKRHVVKTERTKKEVDRVMQSRRVEDDDTSRHVGEIVDKARQKTAFQMTAEGSFNLLLKDATLNTSFAKDADASSSETKRRFREAVHKAAEEYRNERQIEITASEQETLETKESGEIRNPNQEISVTYLFYELQRRFRVSEQIHRLTPVVFVAQEVPRPDEIDEDWLLARQWILQRALLDDSLAPALEYLATIKGDELALEELQRSVEQQRELVADLKEQLLVLRGQLEQRYAALEHALAKRTAIVAREDADGFLENTADFFFGSSAASSEEAARIREDAARDALERVEREEADLVTRLQQGVSALNTATREYTAALREQLNRKAAISQLRVHIKDNLLYYMYAIWDHEPPDQRYFRLHEVPVPVFGGSHAYSLREDVEAIPEPPYWRTPMAFELVSSLDLEPQHAPLAEVADLDDLLGYKGNYMVFPLRDSNPLTRYMMAPYVDAYAGLKDPDPFGNYTLDELTEYVCCLKERLSNEEFEEVIPAIHQAYRHLLMAPRRAIEEMVVPTGHLFIEALPGTHPVLEDFKLEHRRMDLEQAAAEGRAVKLDNARIGARLLAGDYVDPDIDRKIVIHGNAVAGVDAEGPGAGGGETGGEDSE